MNPEHAPQFAGTPVRTAVRRRLLRLRQDARFHGRRQDRRRLPAIPRPQALQPIGQEPAAPPIDVVPIARDRRFNGRVRVAIRQHQNHPRAARVLSPDLETADAAFELGAFIGRQRQRHMAPDSTRYRFSQYQATSFLEDLLEGCDRRCMISGVLVRACAAKNAFCQKTRTFSSGFPWSCTTRESLPSAATAEATAMTPSAHHLVRDGSDRTVGGRTLQPGNNAMMRSR